MFKLAYADPIQPTKHNPNPKPVIVVLKDTYHNEETARAVYKSRKDHPAWRNRSWYVLAPNGKLYKV